jgi:putative sigma-54 modulation protein
MKLTIKGTEMELTEPIRQYAEEKITGLEKFFDNILKIEIDIGLRSHHHNNGKIFYAEVNLFVPGHMVRVVKEAEDLYAAIDSVRDHLKVELEKTKEKMRAVDKKELRTTKEYSPEE